MITEFQTAYNVETTEPLSGDVFVTSAYLYTYPININLIVRRNSSFSSPPTRKN
jgi:hypothetical protein